MSGYILDPYGGEDFSLMPYWLGRTVNAAHRGTYAAPVAMVSGITTIYAGVDAGPHLGRDYALTYSGAGVLWAWKMNRSTGVYASYPITNTVSSTCVAMSRDGQWFVAMSGTTLYSFHNTGTGFDRVSSLAAYAYIRMAMTPDGARFVGWTSGNRMDFYALNTTTGAITAGIASGDVVEKFAWSRDGRYLAIGYSQPTPSAGTMSVYDTHGGVSVLDFSDSISAMTGNCRGLCWNRDGSRVWYTTGVAGKLSVSQFSGGALVNTVLHDLGAVLDYVAEVEVSPSGRYLMVVPFGSFDSRLYKISNDGLGSGLTLISTAAFGTDRGGKWTDFYGSWTNG